MDGAGQDLLAGAAFAGDEDVDVDRRHLAGERHHLAELAEHHRLLAVLRRFLQGPQRQSFLALGVRALEVSNGAEEESDRIHRGDRLDVGAKLDSDFHRPAARGADREDPFRQAGVRLARRPERRERFERPVRAARHRRRRHNRASILENGDEASRDELGTTCVKEQGRDVLEKILSAAALSSHLHVLSRPVPCSRELQLTANVVQPLIGPS